MRKRHSVSIVRTERVGEAAKGPPLVAGPTVIERNIDFTHPPAPSDVLNGPQGTRERLSLESAHAHAIQQSRWGV